MNFQCEKGYIPSEIMTTVCRDEGGIGKWLPSPKDHICSIISLSHLGWNPSSSKVICPGHSTSYICIIRSNSQNRYISSLKWSVTLPGSMPIEITFDSTSSVNTNINLGRNITTILTKFNSGQHVESLIVLRVPVGADINGTLLECSSTDGIYSETETLNDMVLSGITTII